MTSRRAMLDAAGVPFEAVAANVDEESAKAALTHLSPRDLADALAELKAVKVATRLPGLVLGSDSLVALADGTRLDWENLAETVSPDAPPSWSDIEALWDEDGAICLINPRVATLTEVAVRCTLPTCTSQMVTTEQHEWTSWRRP